MTDKKTLTKQENKKNDNPKINEIDKEQLSKEISVIANEMINEEKSSNIVITEEECKPSISSTEFKNNKSIVIDSKTKLKIILFTILTLGVFYILLQKEIKTRTQPKKSNITLNKVENVTPNNEPKVSTKESFDTEKKEVVSEKEDSNKQEVNEHQNIKCTKTIDNNNNIDMSTTNDNKDDSNITTIIEDLKKDDIEDKTKKDEEKTNTRKTTKKATKKQSTNNLNKNKNLNKDNKNEVSLNSKIENDKKSNDDISNKLEAKQEIDNKNENIKLENDDLKIKNDNESLNNQKNQEEPSKSSKHIINTNETKSSDEMIAIKDSSSLRYSNKVPVNVEELIKNFGGGENITNVENSLSTVQIFVKDKNLVKKDDVKKTMNGKGMSVVGQKYSIVCGDFAIALKEEINNFIKN